MTLLNKLFLNYLKISGFLLISVPVFASNKCQEFYKMPSISSVIDYGNVIYSSVPDFEIEKFDKLLNPHKTMGVTVADLKIKYDFDFSKHNIDDGICVNIDKINLFVGYDNLYVLINNKYAEGSCEYNAIKNHEIKHINVYQKEVQYYGKLLVEEIQMTIENLKPLYFFKNFNNKTIAYKIEKLISKNPNIEILGKKLENSVLNLNNDIDNEDEYLRVKARCKNW